MIVSMKDSMTNEAGKVRCRMKHIEEVLERDIELQRNMIATLQKCKSDTTKLQAKFFEHIEEDEWALEYLRAQYVVED